MAIRVDRDRLRRLRHLPEVEARDLPVYILQLYPPDFIGWDLFQHRAVRRGFWEAGQTLEGGRDGCTPDADEPGVPRVRHLGTHPCKIFGDCLVCLTYAQHPPRRSAVPSLRWIDIGNAC